MRTVPALEIFDDHRVASPIFCCDRDRDRLVCLAWHCGGSNYDRHSGHRRVLVWSAARPLYVLGRNFICRLPDDFGRYNCCENGLAKLRFGQNRTWRPGTVAGDCEVVGPGSDLGFPWGDLQQRFRRRSFAGFGSSSSQNGRSSSAVLWGLAAPANAPDIGRQASPGNQRRPEWG